MVAGEGAGWRQRHGAKPRLGLSFALLPAGASPLRLWGSQITVQMEDGSQFSDEAGSGGFMAMDEANLQSGPPPTHAQPSRLTPPLTPLGAADDMVNLGDLHEAALLHNLRIRFFADDIFTHIGPILVACNPYKRLPIFTPAFCTMLVTGASSAAHSSASLSMLKLAWPSE